MNEAILTFLILTVCTISVIVYILKFKPLNDNPDKILRSRLSAKVEAYDHLTYKLLTENRWSNPY